VRPEGLGKFKKIHSLHRVSNPRPSALSHSALTITLTRGFLIKTVYTLSTSSWVLHTMLIPSFDFIIVLIFGERVQIINL
jgi:hypothetical protein